MWAGLLVSPSVRYLSISGFEAQKEGVMGIRCEVNVFFFLYIR